MLFHHDGAEGLPGTYVAPAIIALTAPATSPRKCSARCSTSCATAPMNSTAFSMRSGGRADGLALDIAPRIDFGGCATSSPPAVGNIYVNRNVIGAVAGASRSAVPACRAPVPKAAAPTIWLGLRRSRP